MPSILHSTSETSWGNELVLLSRRPADFCSGTQQTSCRIEKFDLKQAAAHIICSQKPMPPTVHIVRHAEGYHVQLPLHVKRERHR